MFLTGRPGSGKSTAFAKAVEILRERGCLIQGIATPEVRDRSGARVGFDVVDLTTGARAVLSRAPARAAPGVGSGPRVGRYEVDVAAFESVARPALEAVERGGIIAVDEVGKMEFFSQWFASFWRSLLESDANVLAVVGGLHVKACRSRGEILDVTPENRASLPERVAGYFTIVHRPPRGETDPHGA